MPRVGRSMVASAPATPSAKTRPPVRRSAVDKAGGRVCPEYVGATSERRFGRHTSLSRVLAPLQLRGAFQHAFSVSLALLCSLLRAVVRREEPGLARALAKMAAARDLWVVATQLTKKGKFSRMFGWWTKSGFACARNSTNPLTSACRTEARSK